MSFRFPRPFRPASPDAPFTSPLLRPELKRNLWFPSNGGIALHLSRQWKPMLDGLRRLGPLLLASRNRAAILGHYGPYPELPEGDGDRFLSEGGEHFFELLRWHHARVWEQPQAEGVSYAVEFRNLGGNLFHKVCLTPESDFPAFLDWARQHQAIGIEGFPPPPCLCRACAEAARERDAVALADATAAEGKPLEITELFLAFRHLMHAGLPVAVTLGGDGSGLSHTHAFRFAKVGLADGWAYCSDDRSVLHVKMDEIDALAVEPRWWEPGEPLQVCARARGGEPLFLLAPGARRHHAAWNGLVRASFRIS